MWFQVVSFCTSRREIESVWKSMNRLLPRDIRIIDLTEAPHTFNARHRWAICCASSHTEQPRKIKNQLVLKLGAITQTTSLPYEF